MTAQYRRRILAVDVHATHVGYVVIEGKKRLLDWGLLHFTRSHNPAMARVQRVVAKYRIGVVVLTQPRNQSLARTGIARMRQVFIEAAGQSGIPVVEITREQYLKALKAGSRYSAALQMSAKFPVLAARMYRRRKVWQSESANSAIFDAAAAGTACLLAPPGQNAA